MNPFARIIIILSAAITLSGCYVTTSLRDAGRYYYSINEIADAYLMSANRLVIEGTKNVVSRNITNEKANMIYGIDIGQTQITIPPFYIEQVHYSPFFAKEVDGLLKKDHLLINLIELRKPIFASSSTDGRYRIPVLRGKDVTSFEHPFILTTTDRGFIFFNQTDKSYVTAIRLELYDGVNRNEPWWFPIKYPLYIVTIPVDIVTFPFQYIYWSKYGDHSLNPL